jgi:hypothetical protein
LFVSLIASLFVHLSLLISWVYFFVSIIIVNGLILNYTQTMDRNSTHTNLAKNPMQPQNKIKPKERKQVTETTK